MKEVMVTNVQVSLITSTRLAGEEQIRQLLGLDRIPQTMKPLLRQEVIDRKIINPLAAVKKQVRDLLLAHGTREPMLGWVVDPDRIKPLMQQLREKETEYERRKESLLKNYPDNCRIHLQKLREACQEEGLNEEQTELLIRVVAKEQPSLGYLEQQLVFRYLKPRKIGLEPEEYEDVCNTVFEQAVSEIVARCKEAKRTVRNRPKHHALHEVMVKIQGLTYLDARFQHLLHKMEELAEGLPSMGTKEKDWGTQEEFAIQGAINMMADREQLELYLSGQTPKVLDFGMSSEVMRVRAPVPDDLFSKEKQEERAELPDTKLEAGETDDMQSKEDCLKEDCLVVDTFAW